MALAFTQEEGTKGDDRPTVSPMTAGLAAWREGAKKVEKLVQPERASAQDRFGCATDRPARMEVDSKVILTLRGVTPCQEGGISFARDQRRTRIDLYRGGAIFESVNADLFLETPEGRIEGKNAYLLVEVNEGQTRIVVVDGTLTFTNDLGSIEVPAGNTTTVQQGEPPGPLREVDADQAVAWGRACDAENLISNAGFETNFIKWEKREKPGVTIFADPSQAHSGRLSACIDLSHCRSTPDVTWILRTGKDVPVVPGREYLLRVWYRTQGIVHTVGQYPVQAVAIPGPRTAWCPSETSETRWRRACVIFTPTMDKTPVELAFTEKHGEVEFNGKVWFDDFYLAAIPGTDASPDKK